jgi:hypothetical protein
MTASPRPSEPTTDDPFPELDEPLRLDYEDGIACFYALRHRVGSWNEWESSDYRAELASLADCARGVAALCGAILGREERMDARQKQRRARDDASAADRRQDGRQDGRPWPEQSGGDAPRTPGPSDSAGA